jgi:hypothetical protein
MAWRRGGNVVGGKTARRQGEGNKGRRQEGETDMTTTGGSGGLMTMMDQRAAEGVRVGRFLGLGLGVGLGGGLSFAMGC